MCVCGPCEWDVFNYSFVSCETYIICCVIIGLFFSSTFSVCAYGVQVIRDLNTDCFAMYCAWLEKRYESNHLLSRHLINSLSHCCIEPVALYCLVQKTNFVTKKKKRRLKFGSTNSVGRHRSQKSLRLMVVSMDGIHQVLKQIFNAITLTESHLLSFGIDASLKMTTPTNWIQNRLHSDFIVTDKSLLSKKLIPIETNLFCF